MPGSTTKRRSVMTGITTKKKEVVVVVSPPRPEFKWMSKADVIAAKKKDREIAEKTRIYQEGLRFEANPGNGMVDGSDASTPGFLEGAETPLVATKKAEAPVVGKKKAGRPKKIE